MRKHIAVIGCGYWGKNLVRNFYELGVLAVVFDESASLVQSLLEKYPGTKSVQTIESIFQDPEIKGVVIATPAATHYEIAKKALLAGKDVFVEKPLALHYSEGEDLAKIAEASKKILMVGHILEYHPAVDKLKELVQSNALGKIRYLYSNRLSLGKIRKEENVLWSFAPHDISVILSLLDEMPNELSTHGGDYLRHNVADTTISTLVFPKGIRAHIFVSWLHPFKEQRLVVIGENKIAVFDDAAKENKLVVYPHKAKWEGDVPVVEKAEGQPVLISSAEPLKEECQHFLDRIEDRAQPRTGSKNGLRVLKVLNLLQESLNRGGALVKIENGGELTRNYFVHETAVVDEGALVGQGTKIWHFTHVMKGSVIGKKCNLGQNVIVSPGCTIGNNVKIQNNVSVYTGVHVEDDVFLGPSMVFTNVFNPRSFIERKNEYRDTHIKCGASIGANATIVCGHTVGEYSFIGAGAVVTKDVPAYALVYGNPGKVHGWVCRCGSKLTMGVNDNGSIDCQECKSQYSICDQRVLMTKKGNYASTSPRS